MLFRTGRLATRVDPGSSIQGPRRNNQSTSILKSARKPKKPTVHVAYFPNPWAELLAFAVAPSGARGARQPGHRLVGLNREPPRFPELRGLGKHAGGSWLPWITSRSAALGPTMRPARASQGSSLCFYNARSFSKIPPPKTAPRAYAGLDSLQPALPDPR